MKKKGSIGCISKIPIIRLMKIYTILLCITMARIFALDGYAQNISLDFTNSELESIFSDIENKSDFNFIYSNNLVDVSKKTSIKVVNEKLADVLEKLFAKTNIKYRIIEKHIVLYPENSESKNNELNSSIESSINLAEMLDRIDPERITQMITGSMQNQVTGRVVDASGIPLAGVSIIVKGTTNGTSTDFDGNYTLNVAGTNPILVFSYVGFKSVERPVNNQNVINISMVEDAAQLDEVVVVGYGTQKKINVTGSVASIKAEDVVKTPTSNVKGLIIGQVPGVITNQTPGLPGQDNVDLSIRGFGNPLVIVDGVESFLDRIDPNDIESISILKDASAAIYGVRGGDGVILVTTKRGKAGKTQVNYHGYTGVQKAVKFPEPASAAAYIQAKRNGIFNVQYDPQDPNAAINYGDFTEERLEQYQSGELTSYNWVDALLKNGGAQLASHNISASGGSEKVRFYTSLGTLNQDGIFKGDYSYKKLTITNNLDAKLTEDLSLILNSSYIDETRDYAAFGVGTIWNDLRTSQPFYPTALPDPDKVPYSGFTERSPIARTQKRFGGYNFTTLETLAAALELKYEIPFVEGLTIGAKANVRNRRIYFENLEKTYGVYRYDQDTDEYSLVSTVNQNPSFSKGFTNSGSDPSVRLLSRFYADYNNNLGDHNFGALAFIEQEDNEINTLSATRRNLLSDDVPTITAGDDGLTTTGGNGQPVEYSRISIAGRFNYSFKEKYLLEATLRADASSKVSPNVRWGYFPSISLGWNIAKENFMKSSPFNELKLRLSYSETGKDDNIGNTTFDYLTGYNELNTVYYLDGNPVTNIVTAGLVNPYLTWVNVSLYNAGLDFSLDGGKYYGNFDVFYRVREGLVGPAIEDVPSTFGADLPLVNINSRNDHGFEILAGYKGSIGDFKIDLSGTFSYARERYQDIQENIDASDPNQVRIDQLSGRYVNRTFGYISDGLFNTQQEVDEYLGAHTIETINGSPMVGDIRYKDVSGPDGSPDGIINRFDVREIGYGENPDINFSLNTRFSYKNFSLSMLWQGASLFDVRGTGLYRAPFNNEQVPLTLHTKYSWTQDPNNPGIGNNPNAQLPAFNNDGSRVWNDTFSDFWLKDGTFLRLKTATFAYQMPKRSLEILGLNNLEFYVTGDNLFALTRLGMYEDLLDPEQAFNNSGYSLPLLRTYTFGVRLGL
ncbi:TonB-linked outer membrane protein, SusC/RagA family [Zhouia amylolytica]|uniref:TonB-linked outer membrane protein, SusC/RagA family n=2 Tax=Zhouia amylolytica TaxID=376730 RepID=A0A1I6VC54_9FLAO|nr:TonB-linked outer membrane protein, SusC/RagA family [Zhouia amylolytica]